MDTPSTLLMNWRTTKGIGPAAAATEVGVERQTWWRWETGASNVALDKLDRVHAVTGIAKHLLRPDLVAAVAPADPREAAE